MPSLRRSWLSGLSDAEALSLLREFNAKGKVLHRAQ
jgi:hypothetical protein